jgi:predicted kinase
MQTLTMTRGLPASGKTTWAKEQVKKSNGQIKRINKDDLRAMIDAGEWSDSNEKLVLKVRDEMIRRFLNEGKDVIVDDTNLAPKHEAALQQIAENFRINFHVQDFTDVSLSTCLKRDSERGNSVGEKVIKTMYNTYLKQKSHVAQYSILPHNPDLPNCIIVDIDGTLAHMVDRSPYDYTKVSTDVLDETVAQIVRKYGRQEAFDLMPENYVIIVSGRQDTCREDTKRWLADNDVAYTELYMRAEGDIREDSIVKKEIYEQFIKPRYNVRFVLDDRDRVVKMWREQGLKVLQVAPGDF